MESITRYLEVQKLKGEQLASLAGLPAVLDQLAAVGREIDDRLIEAEKAKALMSRAERGRFEEMRTTIGAMSREAWQAHASVCTVLEARQQLADVEARLAQLPAPEAASEA